MQALHRTPPDVYFGLPGRIGRELLFMLLVQIRGFNGASYAVCGCVNSSWTIGTELMRRDP